MMDKNRIAHKIHAIRHHLQSLQGELPIEQAHVGSEMYQIDRLLLKLHERYVEEKESDNDRTD